MELPLPPVLVYLKEGIDLQLQLTPYPNVMLLLMIMTSIILGIVLLAQTHMLNIEFRAREHLFSVETSLPLANQIRITCFPCPVIFKY